jgi:hypothetical protein
MGTSQSSGGPGPGVPMVPSWTPPAPPPTEAPSGGPPDSDTPPAPQETDAAPPAGPSAPPPPAPVLAAPGRFRGVRRSLGDYARSGDRADLKRALGHYVRSGYAGSRTASERMGGTAATAQSLGTALSTLASGQPAAPGSPLDPVLLAGRSAQEVMDAVVEAVRPVDGTQDAEAARAAIRDALSELLTVFPEADLLNLENNQREFVIEQYAAIDVFRRFELDVGLTIVEKSPTATVALARLKDIRDYVRETVGAAFRKLQDAGKRLTVDRINRVVTDAVRETCIVFEGYAE